ncbi:MAG: DinB family protein [Desulfobacterales bacterium]
MDRPFVEENARERKRMKKMMEELTDSQLGLRMEDGWTVGVTFAHLAFWDRRSLLLLRKWKSGGHVEMAPIDIDIVNEALLPTWQSLPPQAAVSLAVSAAQEIDRELEDYPAELVSDIEAAGDRNRLYRSVHRKYHLDRIEEHLQAMTH